MNGNAAVVERVAPMARQAPAGSLQRRTLGCVLVAYSTTNNEAHARRVLDELTDDELRAACHELADHLTTESS